MIPPGRAVCTTLSMRAPRLDREFLQRCASYPRALVTGGAGFIGSNLVEALLTRGTAVISVDNYSSGSVDNHVGSEMVCYYDHNTAENLDWLADFAPSEVYHLGEYSRIVPSFEEIEMCHHSNCRGTFNVMEFCRRHGAKMIYAASSSKFGNDGADENLSPYAWMKAKNVELLANYRDWFGLDYAVTYFFNVYGPRQITRGKYATVIAIFQQCVLEGRPIPIVAPGDQRRDFTHVSDIVEGILLAAERGSGDGYLLGTGVNHTILEVAQMFEHPYEMLPERRGERFSGQAHPSKAQGELGWEAKVALRDYIAEWRATA